MTRDHVPEGRLINVILAECRLILPEAKAPQQTTMSMTAPTIGGGAHHVLVHKRCPGQIGFMGVSEDHLRSYRH